MFQLGQLNLRKIERTGGVTHMKTKGLGLGRPGSVVLFSLLPTGFRAWNLSKDDAQHFAAPLEVPVPSPQSPQSPAPSSPPTPRPRPLALDGLKEDEVLAAVAEDWFC